MSGSVDTPISVTSIYGASTRQGLVRLVVGDHDVQMPPFKAREIAAFLIEAAGAAEGDEILMRVLDRAGLSPQRAAQVLVAMRQERTILERRARHLCDVCDPPQEMSGPLLTD